MREQTTSTEENTVQAKNKGNWIERAVSHHFTVLLTVLALIGGATAMFLPLILSSAGQVDSNLRLHILYMTGGIIAVLGLVETHRKNTVDREKAEVEKENYEKMQAHQASVLDEQQRQFNATMDREHAKIEADREKNNQDHRRQVLAERRSRYSQAVEQLGSPHAPIRMGGVYTLVGLADEWLEDNSLNETEHHKEGQIIINNLCAYIRSPFDLEERAEELKSYSKNLEKDFKGDREKFETDQQAFAQDQVRLRGEQEVRQTILSEIKNRLKGGKVKNKDGEYEIKPGTWSHFDYDFSNAVFFYAVSLNEVVFSGEKISFSAAKFIQQADFSRAIFIDSVYFNGATFHEFTNFSRVHFYSYTNFSMVHFHWVAGFFRSHFHRHVVFSGTHFHWEAGFLKTYFHGHADFYRVYFHGYTAFFRVHLYEDVGFFQAKFSCEVEPSGYSFDVTPDSPYKIETKEEEYNGIKFTIPEEAELFDPDIPSEYEDLTYG